MQGGVKIIERYKEALSRLRFPLVSDPLWLTTGSHLLYAQQYSLFASSLPLCLSLSPCEMFLDPTSGLRHTLMFHESAQMSLPINAFPATSHAQ